jgi:PST family polysaccharide transporter
MTAGIMFVGLADTLADAGMGKALVQKKELVPPDLAQGFTLSLALSVFLYLVLFLVASPVAAVLERPEFVTFLRVLALTLFLVPFEAVPAALLERHLCLGQRSLMHLVGVVPQGAVVLGLAAMGFGYWALTAGAFISRLLRGGFAWYASGWWPELAWPTRRAWDLLHYGIHVCGATLLWFVYSNADFAVVGAMFGPVVLGYYALAFQMISLPVEKLSANVNQVMFAVFCKVRHDRERIRGWFLRLTVLLTFVALPALAGLALVAEDAIPLLLGDRWQATVIPFQLLCPVGGLMVISMALPPLLNALGRPDINLKVTAACTVLFPIGFVVGGKCGGLAGVCAAWLVLYPLVAASLIQCTRHLTGIGVGDILRVQLPVLTGTAVLTFYVLVVQWGLRDERTGLRLIAAILAGVVSYTVWMLLNARGVLADLGNVWRELRG